MPRAQEPIDDDEDHRMSQQPGTVTYMTRSLGYALTSAFALVSGYIMSSPSPNYSEALLLATLLFAALPFFVSYAICFHYQDPNHIRDQGILSSAQKDTLELTLVFSVLLSALSLFGYRIREGGFPSSAYFLSTGLYALMFILYAAFIYFKYRSPNGPVMRHQLVWPVTLSIALMLYYGLFFSELNGSQRVFGPVIGIVVFFFVSEVLRLSRRQFLAVTLLLFFTFALLSALNVIKSNHVSSMLFCLSAAAYLAVLESWRVTAHIARHENSTPKPSSETGSVVVNNNVAPRYYKATFAALVIAGLTVPLQYVFSGYGTIFLVGFGVHALLAFICWYRAGIALQSLQDEKWVYYKIAFGFAFLALLVVDSKFSVQPEEPLMVDLVSFSGFSIFLTLTAFALQGEIREAVKELQQSNLAAVFGKRQRFAYIVSIMGLLACLVVLFIKGIPNSKLIMLKLDYAFVLYTVFIMAGLIFWMISFFDLWPKLKTAIMTLYGVYLTTRVITSFWVALVVIMPAALHGESAVTAITLATPFFLAAMGGFALNDYCDAEKDKINNPRRAIPGGFLTRPTVLMVSIMTLSGASLSVLLIDLPPSESALQIMAVAGVVVYNYVVRKMALAKTVYTSLLCVLPLVFSLVHFNLRPERWLIAIGCFLFILGRELLMDVLDLPGDRSSGIVTVPMLLGSRRTELLSFVLQFMGCLSLIPLSGSVPRWIGWIAIPVSLSILSISMILWWRVSVKTQRKILKTSWAIMVIGIIMLSA